MKGKKFEYIYAAITVFALNIAIFLLSGKFISFFLFINNGASKALLFLDVLFIIFAFAYMFLGNMAYIHEKRKSLGIVFIALGFLLALYYIPIAISLLVKVF